MIWAKLSWGLHEVEVVVKGEEKLEDLVKHFARIWGAKGEEVAVEQLGKNGRVYGERSHTAQ